MLTKHTEFLNISHQHIDSSLLESSWIFDTSASKHITGNNFFPSNLSSLLDHNEVSLPSQSFNVKEEGTFHLCDDIILKNVFFILDFQVNLVSISQLVTQSNIKVTFLPTCCLLQDSTSVQVAGLGELVGELYLLSFQNEHDFHVIHKLNSVFLYLTC